MKKILTAIIVMCVMCGMTANAQMRYGITGGVSINNLKFSQDLIQVDREVGFSAGGVAEYMFPGIGFAIDFGLLYSQRGATLHLGEKKIWASDGFGIERSYLHCVEIPINLRFKFHRLNGFEDYLAPFLFAGPSITFLAGHNDISALDYNGAEVGLQVGAGVELFKNFQLSGCRNWGMTNTLQTKKLDNFYARNRSWNIRLAYFF